ncbi:pyridoxamine 5'-phosphate oxidase family protein [Candidatus Halobonum tyrrellensis]|uniref:Pyridoxamine 5'-phosphate oxidase-like FMN-binding protein n=1 Tax=Candidatus Halobonum tyrrellensis G22 TaxID=1324957 RepID=V4J4A7_9EURY|nr:pyridoxamine 5'-phosphate oxidase family protein [Candidatus Halobonum tyrrellensis]ESP90202.1 pyridoxamine 5'-phosphate oxidase-like FMN-binding protein [Candidatus Halobonum tyrrellensis G22]
MTVPDAVEARIAGAPLSAHLATAVDDRPHVAPVWYVYGEGSLWLFTGGQKLRNLRSNPRVAVSVERADPDGAVRWNATLLGTARVVDDDDRVAAVEAELAETYDYDAGEGSEESDGTDGTADTGREGTDENDGTGALVEVVVASASVSVY